MKRIRIITILMAAIMAWGCSKSDESIKDKGTQLTITASFADDNSTKTTLQDAGSEVYWEAEDEIKVFYQSGSGLFVSNNASEAKTVSFTGNISTVIGGEEGFAGGEYMWGLYPYRHDATYDGTSVTTTLPSQQKGKAGSFARDMNISLAKSSNLALAFYNVCGGLRFSVSRNDITDVVFEGGNNEDIAGKIQVTFSDGVPIIQSLTSGQKQIKLTAPNFGTFESGKWYYIVAAPGTLSNGFKLTINTSTQYAELVKTNSVTVKRGIFGSVENADDGLTFKTKETPTGNIEFKDQIAKYACISKFDTNQDGELSYAEAAAVTDISGMFASWQSVTSFDELKYFTSLTYIGTAMQNLSSLKSVTLPELITSIPAEAFLSCTALDSLTMESEKITSIGYHAFYGCKSLKSFNFFSVLNSIDKEAFGGCTSLISVDLPSTLQSIGTAAFGGCTSLISAVVPNSVTSFAASVFSNCTSLVTASLPSGLTEIPNFTFYECRRLKNFTFPKQITSIGMFAFYNCYLANDGVSTIEIPSDVTYIGGANFNRVRNIKITSTSLVTIEGFGTHTKIFVPAGQVEMYKATSQLADHTDFIFPLYSYNGDSVPAGTVDMGMDIFWATCNLGASNPEDYGDYYAWGETEPYYQSQDPLTWKDGKSAGYAWSSYQWCNGTYNTLTKYCTESSCGTVDNKLVLEKEDDAAYQKYGGNFSTPSVSDWQMLKELCKWVWTSRCGHYGYEVTSQDTGNSIFFPASGYRKGTDIYNVDSKGYYWDYNVISGNPNDANYCYFTSDSKWPTSEYLSRYRCWGFTIRPVTY